MAKFDRKEKELEARYRNEIMELKDRIETIKGSNDTEKKTKIMLQERIDIVSKRNAENESEMNQKTVMIESLRSSIKTLNEKLNSLHAAEQQERSKFERDEISKRSHLQREISMLKEDLAQQKQVTELECGKLNRQHESLISKIDEGVKKTMNKKQNEVHKLYEEIQMKDAQILKYKELLQKQLFN